jgi:hypothetical protein
VAIKVGIEITGLPEVKKQFSYLSDKIQKKVLFRAILQNTKVLENKMKELAPVRTSVGGISKQYPSRNHPAGYLRASIGTIKSRGTLYPTVWVRPRFRGKWDPWYEHFVMGGTVHIKKINPFVDRAWASVGAQVTAGLTNDLERQIQQEIDRL